jgi:hypothetical protein
MTRGLVGAGKHQKCIDRSLGLVQPNKTQGKSMTGFLDPGGGRRREKEDETTHGALSLLYKNA